MQRVEKSWGYEIWIHNDEKYCGKLLHFKKDHGCSLHTHRLKSETFYLQSGKLLIIYSSTDDFKDMQQEILLPGQNFEVPAGLRHQMIALEDSDLFEFSTQHHESDSYRVAKGV